MYCLRCAKVIGGDDCRIDIPIHDLAETIRDHNTVFHNEIVKTAIGDKGIEQKS